MRPQALILLATTAMALAASPEAAPRLAYGIQRLGNAQSATVCEPGAAGTAHGVALEYTLGNWARFNWPSFEPVAGLAQVAFLVRAGAAEPTALFCRVQTEDGLEWQSGPLAVTPEWQQVTVAAAGFTCFRGAPPEAAGSLDLSRATQFQVVPATKPQPGTGRLLIDEIRFLPGGPAWTAEGNELRRPRDRVTLDYERLQDLLGRWQAETDRLSAETERTGRWAADLEELTAAWQDGTRHQAVLHRLAERRWAWQEPVPVCGASAGPAPLTVEQYRAQLRSLDAPPVPLLDLSQPLRLSAVRLCDAPAQEAPAIVPVDGKPVLRHRLQFSAEPTRQTVFTSVTLPAAANLEEGRVLARMRCSSARLNDGMPPLLRLYTDAGGAESWADLRPVPMPGSDWQEVSFDVSNPARQSRPNPAVTLSLAVRFENQPGIAADFTVEMTDLRLAPPEPAAALRRRLLRTAEERLTAARNALATERDRVAALADRLRDLPDLRRLYLASFEQRPPAQPPGEPPRAVADPFAGLTVPPRPVSPQRFLASTRLEQGQPTVRVRATGLPPGTELCAALIAPDSRLLAAERTQADALALRPPAGVARWAPAFPALYRLRLAAVADGRIVACDERSTGLRTGSVIPGGPTALLRHVRQRRQPDWAFLLNGECWFPRMAVYLWPDPEHSEQDGVRLLADLWLDGTRSYGFGVGGATWERYDRHGLTMLSGLAPGYRALESWDDVALWSEEYARACRVVRSAADRPLQIVAQVGNEVELSVWGADLAAAFPDALYHPLEVAAGLLRREWDPAVPVMYVRAGTFREVPPLPHEQICGVNQYTGRYSGRSDEIERDLAELARYALWADRPLMITEWMGPQYSWATGGIGGVSPRGAAWYLERYWRAMTGTPGIVGSSEFTLNWVIAPFEDLTNQTREEAWKNRPPHDPFGGGYTADHVPRVGPGQADRQGPCFRSMQAFQSPLYTMANSPAGITLWGDGAERLAQALTAAGIAARTAPAGAAPAPAQADSHLLLLDAPRANAALPPGPGEPVVRTALNPGNPDLLITTLEAPDPAARERGLRRLLDAAVGLGELRASEGAMTRAIALTDTTWARAYSHYLLEFAGRGYFFSGDDVRTELRAAEFFDDRDQRRPAWLDLSTVVLDSARPLSAADVALAERLGREGANLIISVTSYTASPLLRGLIAADVAEAGTLADHVVPAEAACAPLPVRDLGGVDIERIRRFRPDLAGSQALKLYALQSATAEAFARSAGGQAVILHQPLGQGHVFLVGARIGAAVDVHWQVTHAGMTHPLYDRDTACGLERLSRVVVNLGRFGCPDRRPRSRLTLELVPEQTLVTAPGALQGTVLLTDAAGKPVAGQVRARARIVHGGRTGEPGPYVDLVPQAPGRFALKCDVRTATAGPAPSGLACTLPRRAETPVIASVQVKAYAPGLTPADGAIAYVVATGNSAR